MRQRVWRNKRLELTAENIRGTWRNVWVSDTINDKLTCGAGTGAFARRRRSNSRGGLLEVLKVGGGDVAREYGCVVFGCRRRALIAQLRCVRELLRSELQFDAGVRHGI